MIIIGQFIKPLKIAPISGFSFPVTGISGVPTGTILTLPSGVTLPTGITLPPQYTTPGQPPQTTGPPATIRTLPPGATFPTGQFDVVNFGHAIFI